MKFDQEKIFKSLRLSEFPQRRWWGFWVRFFKTLEVLLFKVLEMLELYRAQKSILGIPSLATRSYTVLQAIVYNGTQEEVLGFRPRRLLHRILKGIPDVEAFERIRFQLTVGENTTRSIESSTETRGFIHLQLPWQIPSPNQKVTWARLMPMGVETMLGRFKLGDYEIISNPVFFLNEQVKWVVISDIDDTIKDSNIAETTHFKKIIRALFKGHYYSYHALSGMSELYQELAAKGVLIIYVTSTPYQLTPFLLKFLRDNKFPEGPIFTRWLGYGRFSHKWRSIYRLLSNIETQKCVLIGDSGEQDLQIYRRIYETEAFSERVEKILIRHIPGTPLLRTLHDKEAFYNNPDDLRTHFREILG